MKKSDTLASSAWRSVRQTRQIHCREATARCVSIAFAKATTARSRFIPRLSNAVETLPSPPGEIPPSIADLSTLLGPLFSVLLEFGGWLRHSARWMTECMACSVRSSQGEGVKRNAKHAKRRKNAKRSERSSSKRRRVVLTGKGWGGDRRPH